MLAIDDALQRLADIDRRAAEVVTFRYFAGMTVRETASALAVSTGTVDNDWAFARAWLHRQLSDKESGP